MNNTEMTLARFDSGTFIEIDDPLSGARFVAMVTETGTEFIDFVSTENPAVPLPIFEALNPVELGDFRTLKHLVLENAPDQWEAFSAFISDLFDALPHYDDLRFMRAVKWAFDSADYSIEKAINAAEIETKAAITRRATITSLAGSLSSTTAF